MEIISGFIQPQPGEASPPTMTNEVVLTVLNMEIVSFTSIYSGWLFQAAHALIYGSYKVVPRQL